MSSQLDILALEPFYGGVRRAMLETLVRCSRHRWTVLRLPPRRIERRLTTAANWFSEQLGRHWVGRVDLLFTSEAMNLASLLRLVPQLARYPSVVYFHSNQLPDLSAGGPERETDLVNLNTAAAATEIWFNSVYHQRTFTMRAAALVDRHAELSTRSPMPGLKAKSRLMVPPIDWGMVDDLRSAGSVPRNPRTVFFETRDANIPFLNDAIAVLRRQGVAFNAVTVGPVDALDPAVPRYTVSEHDEAGQVRGMLGASVVVSAKPDAASDYLAIRAMMAGCRPVLPDAGTYPEILPQALHPSCLYDVHPEGLAELMADGLESRTAFRFDGFRQAFRAYDAIPACRAIDERLEQLVAEAEARKGDRPPAREPRDRSET